MSLSINVSNLAQAAATNDKLILTLLNGNLPNNTHLTTSQKTNLVAAINEIVGRLNTIQEEAQASEINDAATTLTNTWSSKKISDELVEREQATTTLGNRVGTLETTVSGIPKINDAAASTSSLYSSSKVNSLLATRDTEISGVRTDLDQLETTVSGVSTNLTNVEGRVDDLESAVTEASAIDDSTISLIKTWSSSKTDSELTNRISTAIAQVVGDAPEALDTLKELADLLEQEGSSLGALVTEVANLKNGVGPTDTNYVAIFEAALV